MEINNDNLYTVSAGYLRSIGVDEKHIDEIDKRHSRTMLDLNEFEVLEQLDEMINEKLKEFDLPGDVVINSFTVLGKILKSTGLKSVKLSNSTLYEVLNDIEENLEEAIKLNPEFYNNYITLLKLELEAIKE